MNLCGGQSIVNISIFNSDRLVFFITKNTELIVVVNIPIFYDVFREKFNA